MRSFDASSQAPRLWPIQVFATLDRELGDYFVIGSIARDLWAHVAGGLPLGRATEDLDVSVAVGSLAELRHRTRSLDGPNASGVRYRVNDVPVDVIPYGDLESNGHVQPADGIELDVRGMRDAAASVVDVALTDTLRVRFASLPAMIGLKLVAWGIRQGHTSKDATDLGILLDASHAGPFEEDCWADERAAARWDFEPSLVGPYRMGLDLAGSSSAATLDRLLEILNGRDLDRLAQQLPQRALSRGEQLHALRSGLERG
jgi:predicted nucleotidyltransferase